jgi:hypothetical protein
MAQEITVRLSDDAMQALRRLEVLGLIPSEVISKALVVAASRLTDKQALAAEVAALATDPDDRAEILAVAELMELLLVSK